MSKMLEVKTKVRQGRGMGSAGVGGGRYLRVREDSLRRWYLIMDLKKGKATRMLTQGLLSCLISWFL